MSSENPTERAWSAACISTLILSNASTRKLLLSKGVVPILIQRLSDVQQEVRDESLGALRLVVCSRLVVYTKFLVEILLLWIPVLPKNILLEILWNPYPCYFLRFVARECVFDRITYTCSRLHKQLIQ